MTNKLLKYSCLVVFTGLWALGFSNDFSKWFFEKGILKDDYRYGDLYRFSNLPQFRVPKQTCIPAKKEIKSPNTSLYIIGDSFTEAERISGSDFVAGSYERFFIGDTSFVKLDKTKKNILIIETVERHFIERFTKPYQNLNLGKTASYTKKSLKNEIYTNYWYNSERHEAVLFSSDFFLTIKEWKAWINYQFFGRVDDHVVLSKDKKQILFHLDAQPSGITSSFNKISDKEIGQLVENVNITYDFYRKLGFEEVYLTIAPNKTSIVGTDLGTYNHLIERIQNHSSLRMPVIDVYTPFHTSKKMFYDVGDTHWNCEGKQIWIDKVNQKL